MKRTAAVAAVLAALLAASAHAGMKLGGGSELRFATVKEGRGALVKEDEYVKRLGSFDLRLRLRTNDSVSCEEYLECVRRNIVPWTTAEKKDIRAAFKDISTEIQALSLPFPDPVLLVKTTGREDLGRAYTRSNVVVIHQNSVARPPARTELGGLLAHELFHVLSRTNPDLRHRLYKAIGFRRCSPVRLPPDVRPRRITNPDGFRNNHCIKVKLQGSTRWAVPVIYSSTGEYDPDRGHEFRDYVQFRLLLLQRTGDARGTGPLRVRPVSGTEGPRLVRIQRVSGFLEKTGKNTGYIIHPDEILAENVRLLVTHPRSVRSPDVLEDIAEILRKTDGSPPAEKDRSSSRRRPTWPHRAAVRAHMPCAA